MNLDKIIELIAEQIARKVLEGAEDHPDRGDEEDPAMLVILRQLLCALNHRENIWLADACRRA